MDRKILPLFILLISSSPFINTCSLFSDNGLRSGVYEGLYSFGFEVNSFTPCDRGDEKWWVTAGNRMATDSLVQTYRSISNREYKPVFVQLRGKPSKKGKFGHLNGHEREFEIEELILLREARPDDCE